MPSPQRSGLGEAVLVVARLDWGSGSAIFELRVWGLMNPAQAFGALARRRLPANTHGSRASRFSKRSTITTPTVSACTARCRAAIIQIEAEEIRPVRWPVGRTLPATMPGKKKGLRRLT